MGIFDDMIAASAAASAAKIKKETQAQRRKRWIEEGKATESDFARQEETPLPVLDKSWADYANAKAAEEEKKKKKAAKTKAARAVSKSDNPEDNESADEPTPVTGGY